MAAAAAQEAAPVVSAMAVDDDDEVLVANDVEVASSAVTDAPMHEAIATYVPSSVLPTEMVVLAAEGSAADGIAMATEAYATEVNADGAGGGSSAMLVSAETHLMIPRHSDYDPAGPEEEPTAGNVVPTCVPEEYGRYTLYDREAFCEGQQIEYTPEASGAAWYEACVLEKPLSGGKVKIKFVALTDASGPAIDDANGEPVPLVEWVGRMQLRPRPPAAPAEWWAWIQPEDTIEVFDRRGKGWTECTIVEVLPMLASEMAREGGGVGEDDEDESLADRKAQLLGESKEAYAERELALMQQRHYRVCRSRDRAELIVSLSDLRPRFKWKMRRVRVRVPPLTPLDFSHTAPSSLIPHPFCPSLL